MVLHSGRVVAMMPRRERSERKDSEPSSLADQLRTVGKQLRRARRRRDAETPPPTRTAPATQPAVVDDADLFRDATTGAAALSRANVRIPLSPSYRDSESASPESNETDFAADEHFDVRFSDLYIRGRASGVSRETVDRLSRGEFAVRSHVDLHGMAFDDARVVVDRFLVESQKRGERCVLVITGKGKNSPGQRAVLREKIPEWMARGPSSRRVLAFVTARPCDGGEGALYVLLRKSATGKTRIDVEAGGGT